jgi:catabolite regulation protein CreA
MYDIPTAVCVNLKNYYIVLRYYDRTTQAFIYLCVYVHFVRWSP